MSSCVKIGNANVPRTIPDLDLSTSLRTAVRSEGNEDFLMLELTVKAPGTVGNEIGKSAVSDTQHTRVGELICPGHFQALTGEETSDCQHQRRTRKDGPN